MNKKTRYAFAISFVLLLTVVIFNLFTVNNIKTYSDLVSHTRDVITTFDGISDNFKSAQIYTPAYDTGSLKSFYDLYKADADSIPGQLRSLRQLIRDNPRQIKLV